MAGRRISPLVFTGIAGSDETLASGRGGESPCLPSKLIMEPEELRRSLDIKATFCGASTMGVNPRTALHHQTRKATQSSEGLHSLCKLSQFHLIICPAEIITSVKDLAPQASSWLFKWFGERSKHNNLS